MLTCPLFLLLSLPASVDWPTDPAPPWPQAVDSVSLDSTPPPDTIDLKELESMLVDKEKAGRKRKEMDVDVSFRRMVPKKKNLRGGVKESDEKMTKKVGRKRERERERKRKRKEKGKKRKLDEEDEEDEQEEDEVPPPGNQQANVLNRLFDIQRFEARNEEVKRLLKPDMVDP